MQRPWSFFGDSGDLAARKLVPEIYNLEATALLPMSSGF
jgi:glucose-6-phosphate 1-dehydrogenase